MKRLDLTGRTFARLTVLRPENATGASRFVCICSCGTTKTILGSYLTSGDVLSCGCLRKETTRRIGSATRKHKVGLEREREAWASIKQRCLNPKCHGYRNYGGRGITVCDEWKDSFQAFYRDMGPRPTGTSIERIDNSAGYFKENCCWAGKKRQARNRRTNLSIEWQGKQRTLAELCELQGLNYQTVYARITRHGMPIEQALDQTIGCYFRDNNPRNRYLEYNGESKQMKEWAKQFGMKVGTLSYRIKKGWTVERALTTPVS